MRCKGERGRRGGGRKGERTHPVRVVGLKTRQMLVCHVLASHGSNYRPSLQIVV